MVSTQPSASPTHRALRIEPEEVMSTLAWEDWSLERLHSFVCRAGPWVRVPDKAGREQCLEHFVITGQTHKTHGQVFEAKLIGGD